MCIRRKIVSTYTVSLRAESIFEGMSFEDRSRMDTKL